MSAVFKPTEEQDQILSVFPKRKSFKISAFAGSGKTSTLKLIGDVNPNTKCLYLAFNRAIANEAKSKFSQNVKCQTFHALAYHSIPKHITQRINSSRYMPSDIARDFRLFSIELPMVMKRGKTAPCNSWDQAIILNRAVDCFSRSSDKELKVNHVLDALPKWVDKQLAYPFAKSLVPSAQKLWQMCIDDKSDFKISHDIFLKYWSLNDPVINADTIFLDEAQDADPIMLSILRKQDAQIVLVGDRHQQIYSWRGVTNAMQSVKIPEFHLTKSFRFGQSIADTANLVLKRVLGEKKAITGNEKIKSKVGDIALPDAYLARKNSTAFELALELVSIGRKPRIEVDALSILKLLEDAQKLMERQPVSKSSEFFGFNSWSEVEMYIELNEKADFAPFVRMLQKNDPQILRHILENLANPAEYDCTIMTAHKSKGLEFGKVCLLDDFSYSVPKASDPPDHELIDPDEARLIYVASTRAVNELDVSNIEGFYNHLLYKRS